MSVIPAPEDQLVGSRGMSECLALTGLTFREQDRCSRRSHHKRQGDVAMTYFHLEEELQFVVLEEYNDNPSGARYLVEFPDGESYVCRAVIGRR